MEGGEGKTAKGKNEWKKERERLFVREDSISTQDLEENQKEIQILINDPFCNTNECWQRVEKD